MTLAAGDRRLANATVTLEAPASSNGFVNGHAMLHHRWFPRIELDGIDSMDEVVTMARAFATAAAPAHESRSAK